MATDHQRQVRQAATAAALDRAQHADPAERGALEHEVVCLNLEVARDVARRYRGRGIPSEDLEQVASLALVKAVRRFDPTKADDFLSFAVPTIRGEVQRHFRDAGWMVRPPRSLQELQTQVTAAEPVLSQRLGRPPTPQEIADYLDAPRERVSEALAANGCFIPTSLDDPGQEAMTLRLGGEEPGYADAEARVTLRSLTRGLSLRERRLLELRFVLGRTQAEIGHEIGVTQTQVSRQLSSLLERLRTRALAA